MFRSIAVMLVLAFASLAPAQPLSTSFTFQGELRNGGTPASGTYDFRFTLYDAASGGSALGALCSDNVAVADGRFTVSLDFGPQFSGSQRFLQIETRPDSGSTCAVGTGYTALSPRQNLAATPNALFALGASTAASAATASTATQLNGQPPSFYQNAANLNAGTIPDARLGGTYSGPVNFTSAANVFFGSGTGLTGLNASNLSTGSLDPARLPLPMSMSGVSPTHIIRGDNSSTDTGSSGVAGLASAASGTTYGMFGQSNSPAGFGVYGLATATTGGTRGVYGGTLSPGGAGVMGESSTGTAAAIYGLTHSAAGYGVYAWADSTTGATRAVYGQAASTNGFGVYGRATAISGPAHGVYGLTSSIGGAGVFGDCGLVGGLTTGVWGQVTSPDGSGVYGRAFATGATNYGVWGESASTSGYGVYGIAPTTGVFGKATATSGLNHGVYGESPSLSARAVEGRATATNATTTVGVWGESISITGVGVWGESGFKGVVGSGNSYGVYGSRGLAFCVYANGDLGAAGTKSFRIDHPQDPENKYLLHYCAEGPEPQNIYNGVVTLDGRGEADVALPAYFASINTSPRYALTAIGAPMPLLHIARKISTADLAAGNTADPKDPVPSVSFHIAGGVANEEVSWEVKALRNDRWVQQHGAPTEADKHGTEKGKYQRPELYNKPPVDGVDYVPEQVPSAAVGAARE